MNTCASLRGGWRRGIRRRNVALLLLFLAGLFVPERAWGQAELERYEYRQTHMGMPVRVVLYAPQESAARRAGKAAFRRIEALEEIMSSYRPESELNRLSERAGEPALEISEPLFAVLRRAQTLARRSNGAFDVTADPYLALWHDARVSGTLPDSTALRAAESRVGWEKLQLDAEAQTARLAADSMRLNLGGIAKGFILERALDSLSAAGVSRAMIEAGGDLVVSGPPPDRSGWQVRLPAAGPKGESETIRISHSAVSTSGDTEQYVEIDGTRYSHVVDPRTGIGVTHRLLVTIIADDGTLADGLATTVSVLGEERGRAFLDEHFPNATVFVRSAEDLATD